MKDGKPVPWVLPVVIVDGKKVPDEERKSFRPQAASPWTQAVVVTDATTEKDIIVMTNPHDATVAATAIVVPPLKKSLLQLTLQS